MSTYCNDRPNFEFSEQDIRNAVKNKALLSMEIEFSLRCNFRCPFCYTPDESYFDDELSREEIKYAILQARDMGARKIIVLGGEPTLYPFKDYRRTIKGPCRSCEKAEHCYGCRGAAYQMTGDYLASDPTCWLNDGRSDR